MLWIGKFHCPVTFRIFNENTFIVAIRSTGNVYSYEVLLPTPSPAHTHSLTYTHTHSHIQAVERLNLRTKNMRELLTDEPFTKADMITLQDPAHPERFDLSTFYYVKNKMTLDDGGVWYVWCVRCVMCVMCVCRGI